MPCDLLLCIIIVTMLFCIIIKLLLLCQTAKKFLNAYFQFLYLAHHRLIRHRSPSTGLFFVVVVVQSLSRVGLSVTPRTSARQVLSLPLSPGVCSNLCPLSRWCYLTVSSSVAPFSFCLQYFSRITTRL